MAFNLTLILLIPATVLTGLLAGISLDKAVVQLPARHRMGVAGFAAFSRANDLGNGLVLYPLLGVSSALLTIRAGLSALVERIPLNDGWPVYVAAFLALLPSFTTSRAAPNMLRLRQLSLDETAMARALDSFAAWHTLRTVLQCLDFVMLLWALLISIVSANIFI